MTVSVRKYLESSCVILMFNFYFHINCIGCCDGCINVNDPFNFVPMLQSLKKLNDLYDAMSLNAINTKQCQFISRAYLYALAGIFAIEEGIRNANIGCSTNCIPMVRIHLVYINL